MADDIGYNDGITAYENWFRAMSKAIDAHNEWVRLFGRAKLNNPEGTIKELPQPPKFPSIPLEGPNFNEADMSTWPWPRKFFRNTMRKLKDYYDTVNPNNPGSGDPDPTPVPPKIIAPRTFNSVPNGSNARFCITGLPRHDSGENKGLPYDQWTTYDENGLDKTGGRDDGYQVPGLRQANSMDHYGPCDLYDGLTAWPGDKQNETGSYHR